MFLVLLLCLPGMAEAACERWALASQEGVEPPGIAIRVPGAATAFVVGVRGAALPSGDQACSLLRQVVKARIMLEAHRAEELLFCDVDRQGGGWVATVLVDGRDLATVLAEAGLSGAAVSRKGWCG